MVKLMMIVVFIVGGILSWFGYLWVVPVPYGENRLSIIVDMSVWRGVVMYFVMIAGMLARGLYDYSKRCSQPIASRAVLQVAQSHDTLRAAIVSPIVFFSVYKGTSSFPDDAVIYLLFAFQNGFFWRSVLETDQGAQK